MSGAGGPMASQPRPPRLFVPAAVVVGKHEIDGWKVMIMPLRADGHPEGRPIALTPEQAGNLGASLIEMAEICDGRWGGESGN